MKDKSVADLPWSLAGEQFHRVASAPQKDANSQGDSPKKGKSGQMWVSLFGSETCLKLRGPDPS